MNRKRQNAGLAFRALALVLCIAVLVGGTALLERHFRNRRARRKDDQTKGTLWTMENTIAFESDTYGFDHRIESYLFIGTDNNGTALDAGEDYHGGMADFLLLMVLDYTDDTYGCIQIDRNTITQVRDIGLDGTLKNFRDIQICVSHWYGGDPDMNAQNTVEAVKTLFGDLYRIDGYYVLNMEDIGLLNHAVGGVEVTIQQDLTPADPTLVQGKTLTLTDDQAMHFVRSRMSLADDTNEARMSRQKQYMDGLIAKVKSRSAKDTDFAAKLWDSLREAAVTDMSGNDFSRIAQMFLKGENKGILHLEGEHKLGMVLGDGEEHEEFYPDLESILSVLTETYSIVPVDFEDVQY